MIHVLGDSHVCFFNGHDGITDIYPYVHNNHPFMTYRLGAPIAYNLGVFGTMYRAKEKLISILPKIPIADTLLFSFGEIDCRYHIKNQSIKKGIDIEIVVADCVNRYVDAIQQLNAFGHQVGVWGPIASTHLEEKDASSDCWIKGDHLERNKITKLFNSHLKIKCSETGVMFFSILSSLILADGTTDHQYYADSIHLSQAAMPLAKSVLEIE